LYSILCSVQERVQCTPHISGRRDAGCFSLLHYTLRCTREYSVLPCTVYTVLYSVQERVQCTHIGGAAAPRVSRPPSESRVRVTRPSHASESRVRVTRPSHASESRGPLRVRLGLVSGRRDGRAADAGIRRGRRHRLMYTVQCVHCTMCTVYEREYSVRRT
jgi:hypothetical protein